MQGQFKNVYFIINNKAEKAGRGSPSRAKEQAVQNPEALFSIAMGERSTAMKS